MACNDGSFSETDRPVREGPVMCLISKRLRALKKKYNKILQIEESKLLGKTINKEQEGLLKHKIPVAAIIDEYEKLRQPLDAAVKEEIAEHEKEIMETNTLLRDTEAEISAVNKECLAREISHVSNTKEVDGESCNVYNDDKCVDTEISDQDKEVDIEMLQLSDNEERVDKQTCNALQISTSQDSVDETHSVVSNIVDILTLLYFAQLFDVRSHGEMPAIFWTKVHERSSCLSHDCATEDSHSPLLESDLDALSSFGLLLMSRTRNVPLSHKDALQHCINHAYNWLQNSDSVIQEDLGVTYSLLRERLNRILSSEYFTMTPEVKTVEQQVAVSGAEQHPSELPVHGSSTQEQGAGQRHLVSHNEDHMHQTIPDLGPDVSRTLFPLNHQFETIIGDQIMKLNVHEMLGNGHASEETQQKEIAPLVVDHVRKEGIQDGKDNDYSRDRNNASVGLQGYLGPKSNEKCHNIIGGDDRRRGDRGRSYANGRGSRGGGYVNGINGRGGRKSYDQGGCYPTRNNYEQRGGGRDARCGSSYRGGNSYDIGNAYNGYDNNVQLTKGASA